MGAKANGRPGAVLVVGAGIGGIQASLDLANAGFKVYLAEAATGIGGIMAQLDKTFPTNDCAMCIMSPKLVECGRHYNIELLPGAEVEGVSGEAGNFSVRVRQRPRFVDLAKCTGCAECEKVCPVRVPSQFDERLVDRRAIYRLFSQAYPSGFAVDKWARPACQVACPAGVHAQGYVALAREKKYHEAYELVRKHNPFVAICGRVCHHPCETDCRRGEYDEPIAVAAIKRFIADREYEQPGTPAPAPATTSAKTVGVVGAGPAGLTCALRLREMGFGVTVYDEAGEPGGMLTSCLPEYRIPKRTAAYDIDRILAVGMEMKLGTRVGRDVTLGELRKRHDALFVAVGCQAAAVLPGIVEGRAKGKEQDAKGKRHDAPAGVLLGLNFLREAKAGKGELRKALDRKRVVVIGGGNVAVDCARTATRLGAAEVTLMCLETRNLDCRDRMPAHVWEIEAAEAEGIAVLERLGPAKVLSRNGRVTGVETVRCVSVYKDDGSFAPVYDRECEEKTVPADAVIVAIGQRTDMGGWDALKQTEGRIAVDPQTFATSVDGVFAGGDAVSGPASIVEAVRDGNRAALAIAAYLGQSDLSDWSGLAGANPEQELPEKPLPEFVERKARQPMAELPAGKSVRTFDEVEQGLTEEQVLAEASRCLECGGCSECLECERVCEAEAMAHGQVGNTRELRVGAVVVATGAERFVPNLKYEFGYGRFPNVVTSIQFERVLSASGPYQGHLQRPTDGKAPKRVAWLQCVGSRDDSDGNAYCSSVCCMYAVKEAVIAKEHAPGTETTIFYMDIRAHGKDFDRYVERAEKEYGVRFVRARVAGVEEKDGTGNLVVVYTPESGSGRPVVREEFDMVVLSAGFCPPKDAAGLADRLGIRLNQHRFFQTTRFSSIEASRPGVFVCGTAAQPKDIPETVTQASAAACGAAEIMREARGTEVSERVYPPERDVSAEPARIGVFVCHCGINIGSVVNVPSVAEYARGLPGVVHAEENLFTCSQDTQQRIRKTIEEHDLNRVVV
ncbi:4Fe-4S ferredoxin, partial [candidate division WOR-3 bacterium]|nr:4Fe-4S ferredoxin [candidate division WOR-3 bacterium]